MIVLLLIGVALHVLFFFPFLQNICERGEFCFPQQLFDTERDVGQGGAAIKAVQVPTMMKRMSKERMLLSCGYVL